MFIIYFLNFRSVRRRKVVNLLQWRFTGNENRTVRRKIPARYFQNCKSDCWTNQVSSVSYNSKMLFSRQCYSCERSAKTEGTKLTHLAPAEEVVISFTEDLYIIPPVNQTKSHSKDKAWWITLNSCFSLIRENNIPYTSHLSTYTQTRNRFKVDKTGNACRLILKFWDGRTLCVKIVITTGRDCGRPRGSIYVIFLGLI